MSYGNRETSMRYGKKSTMKYIMKKVLVPQETKIATMVNNWLISKEPMNTIVEYDVKNPAHTIETNLAFRSYPMSKDNKSMTDTIHHYFDLLIHQLVASWSEDARNTDIYIITEKIVDKPLVKELRYMRHKKTRAEIDVRFRVCLVRITKLNLSYIDEAFCLLRACQSRCDAYMKIGRYHECFCSMINTLFIIADDVSNVFSPLYIYPYLFMTLELFRKNNINLGYTDEYVTRLINKAMEISKK